MDTTLRKPVFDAGHGQGRREAGRCIPGAGRLALALALAASATGSNAHARPVAPARRVQPPMAFIDFCAHQPAECGLVVQPSPRGDAPTEAAIRKVLAERYFWSVGLGEEPDPAGAASESPPHDPGEPVIREITAAPAVVPRKGAAMKAAERVNAEVNRRIRPAMDMQLYGRDFWRVAMQETRGDCEDYALTKRKELVKAGLPASALSIGVGQARHGELHAVLLVATDKGDVVLDNLSPWIVATREAPYRWRGRQAPGQPMIWERMEARA